MKKGKTPVIDDHVRELYGAIDTSHVVGLRDRALVSLMLSTFVRVEAVSLMKVEDCYPCGKRWYVRLHEKGGKEHEMPAHNKLEEHLDAYITAAAITEDKSRASLPHDVPENQASNAESRVAAGRQANGASSGERRRHRHADRLPHVPGDQDQAAGRWCSI